MAWFGGCMQFIRSKGLADEFQDFCGGWPTPDLPSPPKQALMDAVAHDEQLSIWSDEMQFELDDHVVGPETYDDGVATHVAFQAAIKALAGKVIDRVLDEQSNRT